MNNYHRWVCLEVVNPPFFIKVNMAMWHFKGQDFHRVDKRYFHTEGAKAQTKRQILGVAWYSHRAVWIVQCGQWGLNGGGTYMLASTDGNRILLHLSVVTWPSEGSELRWILILPLALGFLRTVGIERGSKETDGCHIFQSLCHMIQTFMSPQSVSSILSLNLVYSSGILPYTLSCGLPERTKIPDSCCVDLWIRT